MLKALLSQSSHGGQLLRLLPPKMALEIENWPQPDNPDIFALISQASWAEHIHYSWFQDFFRDLTKPMQAICLSSLSPPQRKGLQRLLDSEIKLRQTNPFVLPFVSNYMRKQLRVEDVIDEHLLPYSSLNILLKLKFSQLLYLIDMLGIHDLASDLKQVVDKVLLNRVYAALSKQQLLFLEYCSKQPMKWIPPKLGLSAWNGSVKHLNHLLHHRGLIRLGRAVIQEDPSFKWHLLHRLDTGRAKIIQKEFYRNPESTLLPYFKNQVLHLAKRYL